MQVRLFRWLEREFVEIGAEGRAGVAADVATDELFRNFDNQLRSLGLLLDHAVRVRVWGKDKDARTSATAARSKILTGTRKVASSSFISREWFDSETTAGLELLVMKPLKHNPERRPVEFEPARNYLWYLRSDSVVSYSGYTSEADTLNEQIADVLKAITSARAASGGLTHDFAKTGRLSVFLRRDQSVDFVKAVLAKETWINPENVDYRFVDGFAGEEYLLEIEATGLVD